MEERFNSRQVKTWQLLVCGGQGRRKVQGRIHRASWLRHMNGEVVSCAEMVIRRGNRFGAELLRSYNA